MLYNPELPTHCWKPSTCYHILNKAATNESLGCASHQIRAKWKQKPTKTEKNHVKLTSDEFIYDFLK